MPGRRAHFVGAYGRGIVVMAAFVYFIHYFDILTAGPLFLYRPFFACIVDFSV